MTFIKVIILIILCILLMKILRVLAIAIKAGHNVSAIFISPIKRLIIWEYNSFKTVFINLFSTKVDIFKSLQHEDEVGVVRDNLAISNNFRVFLGLFDLTWQVSGLILISAHSYDRLLQNILDLKLNLVVVIASILISILYVFFKVVIIKPYEDIAIKSTMPLQLKIRYTNRDSE